MKVNEVVYERTLEESEGLEEVGVLSVESKQTSQILNTLSEYLPLSRFNLTHLKRVRKSHSSSNTVEIIFCPSSYFSSIPEHVLTKLSLSRESLSNGTVRLIRAARYEIQNRNEFNQFSPYWPVHYYPSELERLRSQGLKEDELLFIDEIAKELIKEREIMRINREDFAAIIVNPNNRAVIAKTSDCWNRLSNIYDTDKVRQNPLLTPIMMVIDQVAAISREEAPNKELLPAGHYLCTGLDAFVFEEPDIMSSMALVHSRIRRLYFIQENSTKGALKSGNAHIHSLRALNHNYRVFQIIPEE